MQHTDTAPSPVPAVAKPEGDTPAPHRWAWVEASIWTNGCWRPWTTGSKEDDGIV